MRLIVDCKMCAVTPRSALLILARGIAIPVASPVKGRIVRPLNGATSPPSNRFRRFTTGRVFHPAPDPKGAFPLPSGLPMDRGFTPDPDQGGAFGAPPMDLPSNKVMHPVPHEGPYPLNPHSGKTVALTCHS